MHDKILELKKKELEKKNEINEDIKTLVKETITTINNELETIGALVGVYDIENFKKVVARKIVEFMEDDAKLKLIKSKNEKGEFTEKELYKKFLELEELNRKIATARL